MLSLIAAILIIAFLFISLSPVEVREFQMSVGVGSGVGIDVGTEDLTFGTLLPSATAERPIILVNNDAQSKFVRAKFEGELAQWATISENNFILLGNEEKTIKAILEIPKDAPVGDYTGKLIITLRRLI